jgi:hypothetical protein
MRAIVRRRRRPCLAGMALALLWFAASQTVADEQAPRKAIQTHQLQLEKTSEERRADPAWRPSHKLTAVITRRSRPEIALNNFCLNTDGNILACCGGEDIVYVQNERTGEYERKNVGEPPEICVLSPAGNELKSWPLRFKPSAICVADDGTIFVAGPGRLAKVDREGNVLLVANAPQMADLPPLPLVPDERKRPEESDNAKEARKKRTQELQTKAKILREKCARAAASELGVDAAGLTVEQVEKAMAEKVNKMSEEQRDAIRAKIQAKLKDSIQAMAAAEHELRQAELAPRTVALTKWAEIKQRSSVTGIAVSNQDVFVACRMTNGDGYAVWRVDRNFANPKRIIEGLKGIVAQTNSHVNVFGPIDIQAKAGEVWVAHPAAHKVERYDRNGKKLSSFGKHDSKSADGFGGYGNPISLRLGPNGEVYCSETGGPVAVKRFSPDGRFLGVVGLPDRDIDDLCAATVDVSRDGRQVFILSPHEKAILVLTEEAAKPEVKADAKSENSSQDHIDQGMKRSASQTKTK